MKSLLFTPLLCALGFSLLPLQAQAGVCDGVVHQKYTHTTPSPLYGSFVYSAANTSGDCDTYSSHDSSVSAYVWSGDTSNSGSTSSSVYLGNGFTGITKSSASSSLMSSNLSVFKQGYSGSAHIASASSLLSDTIWFEKAGASSGDITDIPFEFCGSYSSTYLDAQNVNNTGAYVRPYMVLSPYDAWARTFDTTFDTYTLDSSYQIYFGNTYSAPYTDKCMSGDFKLGGTRALYAVSLYSWVVGTPFYEVETGADGYDYNIGYTNGSFSSDFKMTVPSGVTCYSASGTFPGCERSMPSNLIGLASVNVTKEGVNSGNESGLTSTVSNNGYVVSEGGASGGTGSSPDGINAFSVVKNKVSANTCYPINFALGFKHKTQTDYSSNSLAFTRFYRSDSTWTSDSLGSRWRHNYDRALNVITSPESATADIVDASGAMTVYRQDSATNDWIAVDQDINATLVSVYDATPTLTGYIYTTAGDRKEYFDTSGKLTRLETRSLQSVDLAYDGSDRLQTITDEGGSTITLSYDGSNRVATMASPSGTFTYAYDSNGNLSTVTKPDTKTRTYHYEDTSFVNALTGITNEKSVRIATYAYDSVGRAVSSEHIGGVNNATIAYNADDTTTVTNALGKDTIYTFETIQGARKIVGVDGQSSASCVASNKGYTYDELGYLTSKTDWKGNTTTYVNDDRGLVTSMTQDAYGSAARSVTTTYEPVFHLRDVVTQTGKTTDYDYDVQGRVTSITVTDTATSDIRVITYTYKADTTDANGNTVLGRLASVTDARGNTTSYDYDSSLRLIKVTNAAGHVSETLSFDSADRPLTLKDANGVITTLVYDALGRLSTSTKDSATTTYAYDDNGSITSVTAPNGVIVSYAYDNVKRLTGITDALGNTITYTLDNAGNRTAEVYKDSGGVLKYTSTQTFDELSRLLDSVDANLDKTTNIYDVNSNVTSVSDGNYNATSFAFDGLNRLTSTTDALSGITSSTINELDQTTDVNDPRGNSTSYSYNAFGDVVSQTSSDTGTTSYTVDNAGNITSQIDARGIVTNYSYDALNLLTSTSYPSDASLDTVLSYDSASGCGYSKGNLCNIADASGNSAYIYDAKGLLTSVTKSRGSLTFITSYSYDASGTLTSITLPSGRNITYSLDANGQVASVSADVNSTSTSLASSINYLPFGGIAGLTYGNGVTLSNTHNTAYQLTNRAIGSMLNDSYSYDNAGNITIKGATSYTYDALYRLTDEDSDSYSYDAIANRLSFNSEIYSYPSISSILDDIDGVSIVSDSAGNITADTARTYVYDAAGHVESIDINGVEIGSYIYDANNQRTSKTASSVTTHYVYGAGGLLYGEYDATGALIREYVYLNGEPLAQVDSGEVLSYLHTDHLGTPRYASDTSGSQVWSWDSDAFGNGASSGSATVNLRFAGQYWDDESDLHYNWNRYYNPETGRYITSDPIGLAGGLNTYAYVSANPVMFTDPEGLVTLMQAKESLIFAGYKEGSGLLFSWVAIFDEWLALERKNIRETNWTSELESCPVKIQVDQCSGNATSPNSDKWYLAKANSEHEPGVYELRSSPTIGGHASQCVYDSNGDIMRDIPAAGSADYYSLYKNPLLHNLHDLDPWYLAKDLGIVGMQRYYSVRPPK